MRNAFSNWLEDRTGLVTIWTKFRDEPLPGGPKWRYIFGHALAAAFLIQLVTGMLLMTSYVPSASQAWGSVWYIHRQMPMGWFIRGLHHFGSSAVVVLVVLHFIQVVLTKAYRPPREVNWWLGLLLAGLAFGFALTGYLLPWDQKGYWATKVATNIMGSTPVAGPSLLSLVVGGPEYGNQTLTRLFSIHVAFLPLCLITLLVFHVLLYYRHGATAPANASSPEPAWPGQILRNLVGVTLMLTIVVGVVLYNHGVTIEAPADPGGKDYPARPEWYFLALFQMLNYFKSPYEVIGIHVLPGLLFLFFAALPLLARWLPRWLVHLKACAVLGIILVGAGYLMTEAILADQHNTAFQENRKRANAERDRADKLASLQGVPPDGAFYILHRDPLTRGSAVLNQKCLSCHYYDGKGQVAIDPQGVEKMSEQTASDLKGFGTRDWVRGLLENPADIRYLGATKLKGMKKWKKGTKLDAKQLDAVTDFVAELAKAEPGESFESWKKRAFDGKLENHPGSEPFQDECGMCHLVGPEGAITSGGDLRAPNLFGYGSPAWLAKMIEQPGAEDMYGYLKDSDRMTTFRGLLTENDQAMLVRFLLRDYPK